MHLMASYAYYYMLKSRPQSRFYYRVDTGFSAIHDPARGKWSPRVTQIRYHMSC